MVKKGERLPEWTLLDDEGREVPLASLLGKPLVLYFYPRALTPGCTREVSRFNDLLGEFEALGVGIVGVSTDPPSRLRRFREKLGLRFTLLSDTDGAFVSRLNVLKKGTKRPSASRVTLIVSPEGEVLEVLRNVRPAEVHADEALARVRVLFGSS